MWMSENNLHELVLFYHVDSWNQPQVSKLGSKSLYLLSYLTGILGFFEFKVTARLSLVNRERLPGTEKKNQ